MSTAHQEAPQKFDIRPLTGALGAEITGLDVKAMDGPTFDAVYQAFLDYSVLVFRDQELTEQEFADFGQRFPAPPEPYHRRRGGFELGGRRSGRRSSLHEARPAHGPARSDRTAGRWARSLRPRRPTPPEPGSR